MCGGAVREEDQIARAELDRLARRRRAGGSSRARPDGNRPSVPPRTPSPRARAASSPANTAPPSRPAASTSASASIASTFIPASEEFGGSDTNFGGTAALPSSGADVLFGCTMNLVIGATGQSGRAAVRTHSRRLGRPFASCCGRAPTRRRFALPGVRGRDRRPDPSPETPRARAGRRHGDRRLRRASATTSRHGRRRGRDGRDRWATAT